MADLFEYGLTDTDIQFLKKKLDEGNLITVHGNRTTSGEICAYTPSTGYTFYHLKSLITVSGKSGAAGNQESVIIIVSVQNDGTTKDVIGGSGVPNQSNSAFFNASAAAASRNFSDIPDKLVGNSTKKYSLNCDSISHGTVYGTIIGYIEAT